MSGFDFTNNYQKPNYIDGNAPASIGLIPNNGIFSGLVGAATNTTSVTATNLYMSNLLNL